MTTPFERTADIATVSQGGAMLIDRMRRLAPPSDALDLGVAVIKLAVAQSIKAMQDAA